MRADGAIGRNPSRIGADTTRNLQKQLRKKNEPKQPEEEVKPEEWWSWRRKSQGGTADT